MGDVRPVATRVVPIVTRSVCEGRLLPRSYAEGGGAMVYYGLPTIWAPEIEPMILDEVSRQLAQPF